MSHTGASSRPTYTPRGQITSGVRIAHHEILGEDCIQKTYVPGGRDDAIAFAEPRLLNELDHPYITPLRDAQFDPDRPGHVTIIMRVYWGSSIHAAIEGDSYRFSIGTVIGILQNIATALFYLHNTKRYVHRDIKPKNVLLDTERRTGFLADFGSAAKLDANGTVAAARTTDLYQAPEAATTGRVGPAADIYALGLTAFEMLNGLFPYQKLNAAEVLKRVTEGRRAVPDRMLALAAFAPHVPDQLRRLTQRMFDADPTRRPSAATLLRDLRALRCLDWCHVTGSGIDGEWTGRWPPQRRAEKQIELSIKSVVLQAGASRGRRRLTGHYRTANSAGWRILGIAPVTVDSNDSAAVTAFFRVANAKAARRWPA